MSTLLLTLGISFAALGVIFLIALTVLLRGSAEKSASRRLKVLMAEKQLTPKRLRNLAREVTEEQIGRMALPYLLCILGLVFIIVSLCI